MRTTRGRPKSLVRHAAEVERRLSYFERIVMLLYEGLRDHNETHPKCRCRWAEEAQLAIEMIYKSGGSPLSEMADGASHRKVT